ncbi:hypothetical protein ACH42_17140 [Endozoicomonas sp. (ex Bugula neritina AB1)]|nr:hypothetical protein ACH42_17140 [Endozoicomonas sp. (ex Bugula neritina AB1)]
MTPGAASREGKPIEIYHPIGMKRYPAQLFDIDGGIAWIEYGWAEDDPMSRPANPIHMATGLMAQTTRDDMWEINTDDGTVTIRLLDEKNPEDRALIAEMDTYQRGDRQRARENINADLQLSIPKD